MKKTGNKILNDKPLLKACIDSLSDMIVLAIDKEFNYLAFNNYHREVMLQAYGKVVEPGMNLIECMTNQDDIIKAKANYGRALKGESHITIEEFGEIDRQYYETRYNPVYNENNEIIGVTAFASNVTDRLIMESALKSSENRYRELIELAVDGILICSKDGKIIEVNSYMVSLTGRKKEEIIGSDFKMFFSDTELEREPFRYDLLQKGETRIVERNLTLPDGSLVPVEMHSKMMPDGTYQSIWHDTRGKRDAISSLEKRNAFIQAILDNLPIGLAVNEIDSGAASYINKKFSDIYGWPAEEITDISRFFELVYPDPEYRDEISKRIMEDINSGDINRMNWEGIKIQTKEHGRRIISASNIPIVEQNIMVSLVRDITESKKTEEMLVEKTNQLELALNSSRAGIWDWDIVKGNIIWTKQMFDLFGLDADKYNASFDSWKKALHPGDQEMAERLIDKALKNREKLNSEYRVVLPDGNTRWINAIGEGIYNDLGQAVRMNGICLDITDRKNSEKALRESEILFKDIFENVVIGVAYTTLNGKVLEINKPLEQILEIPKEKVVGKNIINIARQLLSVKNLSIALPLLSALIKRKEINPFQVEYKGKTLEISASINKTSDRMTGIVHDITELKGLEKSLRKKIDELEWLNQMMAGRELKMIELKKEINTLLNRLGEKDKYVIHGKSEV